MKTINISSAVITPAQAREMLNEFPYSRQRTLNSDTVRSYGEEMRSGEFEEGTQITIAHAPDENGLIRGYLVDGQHRLNAVIAGNIEYEFTIRHAKAESMEDVGRSYGKFDIQKRRNVADSVRALQLAQKYKMSDIDTKSLVSAIPFLANGFKKGSKYLLSLRERVALADEYAPSMRVVASYFEGGLFRLVHQARRVGPLSVALVTVRDARQVIGGSKVCEFWNGTVRDDALKSGDPRKVAARALYDSWHGDRRQRKNPQEHCARTIINAFNAWSQDKELFGTRVQDVLGDVVIYGTRFSSKRGKSNGTDEQED